MTQYYHAEHTTCRDRLLKFCVGNGADLGFGGAPVLPSAICIDRPEGHPERAAQPPPVPPTHFAGDVCDLPFKDGVLDYVFSSHCLEDMDDTAAVVREWVRVLKVGGYLVLFLPDQQTYRAYSLSKGATPNLAHKHADFSAQYMQNCVPPNCVVAHVLFPVPGNPYSFDFVIQKVA